MALGLAHIDITDCDRLAANPPDPDRIVPGVERVDMDLPRAISACKAAVAQHPNTARLAYQLGRCLFYAGDIEAGLASFRQAAHLGYRQAHFILGLIMMRGSGGVVLDIQQVEHHWRTSARLDHANAQVSYVRAALQGRFDHLDVRASREEMRSFLERARPQVDYLGGLLVEDLLAALN